MVMSRRRMLRWSGAAVGGVALIVLGGALLLPRTYRFETELTVSRPPDRVWAWFIKPSRWARRFPIVQSVGDDANTPMGVGTQRRVLIHLPGGETLLSDIIVTDFTPGSRYADRHLGDWLDGAPLPITNVTDRLEFDPDGQGRTRVTFTGIFEVTGLWNRWLAYFTLKPMANRVIAQVRNDSARIIQTDHPKSPT